jgi:L-alanine-DL-glutamate epimerase-like enolase superfamily enzyme
MKTDLLRIVAVDVFSYELGYAHGEYVMSGGRAATRQTGTLVRIRTDSGAEGWGEATPLGATYLPTSFAGVRAALGLLAPTILGQDPSNLSAIRAAMDAAVLGELPAKSAIDIACWDLRGRSLGRPIVDLLGGRLEQDFALYEAVPLGSPEAMVDFVRTRHAAGITKFQLKVGNDPDEDVARVRAVHAAAPEEVMLIADANGGWDIAGARRAIRGMADLDVYVEQPCRTTEDSRLAVAGSALPLILDESVVTADDLVTAKQVGAVAVNLKLGRVGGISRAAFLRTLAAEIGLRVCVEDTWGGDVVTAAVSHVAASTPRRSLLSTSFFNDWTDGHVAGYQPRSAGGRGRAPAAPGLGIDVDAAALGDPVLTIDEN